MNKPFKILKYFLGILFCHQSNLIFAMTEGQATIVSGVHSIAPHNESDLIVSSDPVSGQFQEVLDFLADRQEQLDFLATEREPFTFCIDGGGSKTLLQIVDARGRIIPLTKNGKVIQSVESGALTVSLELI